MAMTKTERDACPTCHGTGTLALAVADVQRLALRAKR